MAQKTARNPRLVQGPPMAKIKILAANSTSWKAGQFLTLSSGLVAAAASDDVAFKYIALEDQADTSTTGDVYVKVGVITKDHIFEMNATNAGTPSAVTEANRGVKYALYVASNICYIDVGDTGNDSLMITELGPEYDTVSNASGDTNALVRCRLISAVFDA